mmetsp:Transcript_736/g.1172  ORF Transcript_736/g.1172 Transcript_736/m.1172 type:complete len:247 (-) Transcript_736:28-768(-)
MTVDTVLGWTEWYWFQIVLILVEDKLWKALGLAMSFRTLGSFCAKFGVLSIFMNPWDTTESAKLKTYELGELGEVWKVGESLGFNCEVAPSYHLASYQKKLLETIDECAHYSEMLKYEQDLDRFGELVSEQEIDYKTTVLKSITKHLKQILDNKELFMDRLSQNYSGSEINIEEDKQKDFLELLKVVTEKQNNFKLLSQATKIHPNTLSKLQNNLNSLLEQTQEAIDLAENSSQSALEGLKLKYNI